MSPSPQATAPTYPDRPIRIIAPYAAGGQSDTVIRLLAPKMSEALGQTLVIENRTGAGGSIGAGVVAQAPADGYTLLFESFAFLVVPFIVKGLAFDYETAFAPVGQAVALPYVLVVRKDFPATDLAGFIAHARANPGVSYGTPGIGTVGHLAGALLESAPVSSWSTLPIAAAPNPRGTWRPAASMPPSAPPIPSARWCRTAGSEPWR